MSDPALDVQGVTSGYGESVVLRDVSFTLPQGEVMAILGKNGMGKTTLLKTVMGFLPVLGGHIRIDGQDTTGLAPHRMARRHVAYSPQDQAIFQDLSVEENLRLGLPNDRRFAQELERVTAFFPFLAERRKQRAGTLSGGEQKMLLVARALLPRPRLLLIDEITEGLQPSVVQRLAGVLRQQISSLGVAILLIEQNLGFALSVADRYAVLTRGEIVASGRFGEPGAEASIHEHLAV